MFLSTIPEQERISKSSWKFQQKQKLDPTLQTSADASASKAKRDQRVILKELGVDASLLEDIGANASGQYDLVAVLTHVGRAADSGHYIGWVKDTTPQAPNAPQKAAGWLKFDDDRVSPCSEEEIARLEGGGDWHTAYICLYRAKQLE